jgi:outer membrane protein
MRRILAVLSLTGTLLFAQSLPELVRTSQHAPLLKAAGARSALYHERSEAAKSARYPSLDAAFSGTYLKEEPVVFLQSSFTGLPPGTTLQTQSQELYFGALRLTYPLFTGFAASAGIDAASAEAMKARLEEEDARRNLYLRLTRAYAEAVAMKNLARADGEALDAMEKSYAKAKGFFEKGLLAESELLRIEADRFAIKSLAIRHQNGYETALLQLSYLSDTNVTQVTPLPLPQRVEPETVLAEALASRPDLRVLKEELGLARQQERAAKSGYYPSVALYGQLASQGDSWELDGDGYTNKDKSAAGFEVTYNLFSGFKTAHESEAARKAQLGAQWRIAAYEKQIETEIRSSHLSLQSLRSERDAAALRVDAEKAYYARIEGQFENQLADADLLSRAIASLAKARSELSVAEARLYAAYATLLLQVGPDTFEAALKE